MLMYIEIVQSDIVCYVKQFLHDLAWFTIKLSLNVSGKNHPTTKPRINPAHIWNGGAA